MTQHLGLPLPGVLALYSLFPPFTLLTLPIKRGLQRNPNRNMTCELSLYLCPLAVPGGAQGYRRASSRLDWRLPFANLFWRRHLWTWFEAHPVTSYLPMYPVSGGRFDALERFDLEA
jgi:hypothetical protein